MSMDASKLYLEVQFLWFGGLIFTEEHFRFCLFVFSLSLEKKYILHLKKVKCRSLCCLRFWHQIFSVFLYQVPIMVSALEQAHRSVNYISVNTLQCNISWDRLNTKRQRDIREIRQQHTWSMGGQRKSFNWSEKVNAAGIQSCQGMRPSLWWGDGWHYVDEVCCCQEFLVLNKTTKESSNNVF